MDFRTKAQRWVSVICCTVLLLSAVQIPARRGAAAAESFAEIHETAFQSAAQAKVADWFQFPLSNYVSPAPDLGLDFGDKRENERGDTVYHLGEDVYAAPGTDVFAAANGEVRLSRSATDFEGTVVIDHRLPDGSHVCSVLGHLDTDTLHPLGAVSRGERIGVIAGGTGSHLHFGIRKGAFEPWPLTDWGRTTDASILDDWWDPTDFVLAHAEQEPSGQRLAYIGSDHNLWLMNADGSGRTALTQDGLVSMFAWAPYAESIAVVRDLLSAPTPEIGTDVAILSLASSTETLLLDDLAAIVSSIAWTPDGTRLALLTYNLLDDTSSVIQVDAESGATMILDSWQPEGIGLGIPFWTSGVSWAPDGKALLVYGYPSRTEVLTVDAGVVTEKVFLAGSNSTGSLADSNCLCPRWSPDGSLIACHDFDRILVVTPDGNLVHELPVSERGWHSPAWSPDGRRVASGGGDGLWVIDTQSGERTHLVTREAWEPSWSPDGQYLAFSLVEGLGGEYHEVQGIGVIGADGVGLSVFEQGSRMPAWQPLPRAMEEPRAEAGQDQIAFVGEDGNIWLTQTDGTGQRRLTDISDDLMIFTPDWCPDGERIVYNVVIRNSGRSWCQMVDVHGGDLGRVPTDGGCDTPACHEGKIVFHDYRRPCTAPGAGSGECGDIYVADLDTGLVTRLTDDHHNLFADWSPDGAQIAFWSYRGNETSGIYILNADGTGERLVVPTEGATSYASWSPNGSEIAFWVSQEGLLIANIDGATLTRVPGIDWSSWASTRIGWSMDGTSITLSNSEGVWVKELDSGDMRKIANGSRPAWQPQPQAITSPSCGTWDGSASDQRIQLTRISESAGDECRGAFTFSNETEWWGDWGAYTLELEVRRTVNANAAWVTLLAPVESIESTFLLPSLDRELHTSPLDIYSAAQVSVGGEMTLASITIDLALQALTTAIDLIPGGSCLIPEEQLAYAAASFAYILAPAARLVWEGDLDGAWEELEQLLPQFLDQCAGALREVASDCVAEGLKTLLGKGLVIAKLAGECIIWSTKAIWDYFDYEGRPVYATMVYEVPVIAEQFGPGRIVFVSHRDDNYGELYVMDGDGQNQTRLTNTPGVTEWHPAWSPDGSRIVFQCELSGAASFDVCLINPDGSGYTRITDWEQGGSAQRPVWSPDGSQIAVSREMGDGTPASIWLMNADGSNQRQLIEGRDPSWSPDGTRIAFEGQLNGGYPQLFTVHADGSDLRQLTDLPDFVMYPTWSPDGRQIAFEVGMTYVAVIDVDGGPVRTVVDKRSWNLSWSPDGTQLALAPMREGVLSNGVEWQAPDGIWVVNLDGSGLHQIAQEGVQPSWHR